MSRPAQDATMVGVVRRSGNNVAPRLMACESLRKLSRGARDKIEFLQIALSAAQRPMLGA